MGAFCRWYEKDMENLTEHEQEQCAQNGQNCFECRDLVVKGPEETQGSSRMTLQEFEASGGCEGCQFYQDIEIETEKKTCVFPWFCDDADAWEFSKNCDEIAE